jgi:hypothetical protein
MATWIIVGNSEELDERVRFEKGESVSGFKIDDKKILIKTEWIDSSNVYIFKNIDKSKLEENNKHRISFNSDELNEWYNKIVTKLNNSMPYTPLEENIDTVKRKKFMSNFKMPGGKYDKTYLIVQRDSIQEIVKFKDDADINLYRILKDRKIRLTFEVLIYNNIQYNKLKSITVMWDDKIDKLIHFNGNNFKKDSYKDKIKKSNKTIMDTILHE